MTMQWLSFCDANRPAGSQFLGGLIVRAPDFTTAIMRAHALGLNPGGEVRGAPVNVPVPERWIERLLSREEIAEMEADLAPAPTIH
jgi:hypothetical protein